MSSETRSYLSAVYLPTICNYVQSSKRPPFYLAQLFHIVVYVDWRLGHPSLIVTKQMSVPLILKDDIKEVVLIDSALY